ncbi:MAG TPA: site-2 protease family protein [Candidatus Hydrogenedentes bacterium]|nr:site-2 protease family protein [Candidatus Hydrogenedentota bacterium]HOL76656.1 site-2 protease family protein [Candidatus Hydrogenedentota bacterium]HPO84489.1 site-2 protease family protein [Candidatus Hydrogenedentota bacterium]
MRWSWRIGRIAGIDIYFHVTFLILVLWVALASWARSQSVADALRGVIFIGVLFGIVVLHELGHALAARRYGIRTRYITLLPIGGVARLEHMPDDPKQELVVSVAGPAVNAVLALAGFGLLFSMAGISALTPWPMLSMKPLVEFVWINVVLAVFNLVPAFPMDGGRVLRALLALRMDYLRATTIAAGIGQALALLIGFAGLFFNPFLVFIALFVWIGAAEESSMVQMRSALGGIPVRRAMITEYHSLTPEDPLAKAIEFIMSGFQHDFPVVAGGRVVGILPYKSLMKALSERGAAALVGECMETDFPTANPNEMLNSVFARIGRDNYQFVPVIREDTLEGILTPENLAEFLMINAALKSHPYKRA